MRFLVSPISVTGMINYICKTEIEHTVGLLKIALEVITRIYIEFDRKIRLQMYYSEN